MEEFVNHLTLLARQNEVHAYALLFLSAFIENVFPPIPGDTVTLVGAYFVGTGSLRYEWVLLSTSLGSVLGFMALYFLAVRSSPFILDETRNRWIDVKKIERVNRLFARYGYWIILANRFLSGIRSVISLSAGMARLNAGVIAGLATLSALAWNGGIIYLGAYLGKSWQDIQHYLDLYNRTFLAILGVLAAGFIGYYFWKKRCGPA